MKQGLGLQLIVAAGCFAVVSAAPASTVWDEAINGDLSNDGLAPTALAFASGSNTVLGSTGNANQGERDYFSFTVPTGTSVVSLTLLNNTFVSGSSSFIALQAGPQITVSPTGAGAQNLLGFLHYENSQIGTDILPFLNPAGSLSSGTYSIWLQELGGTVDYGLDFGVTPVPLPGAAVLLFSGLLGLGTLRKRRGEVA